MRVTREKNNDKYRLYLNAFYRTAKAYADNQEQNPAPFVKKLIVYGVKAVNAKSEPGAITMEEAMRDLRLAETTKALMGGLTPEEFVNLFPITKDYDGHKYQTKDYFYTRDYINSLPKDEPIGDVEAVTEFLWEYQNWEINFFLVNTFGFLDNLRRLEGQPSIMEAFCDDHGIKTYTMHTDQKGRQFLFDKETGKTCRVRRRMPRYLRPVSAGKGGEQKKNKPI